MLDTTGETETDKRNGLTFVQKHKLLKLIETVCREEEGYAAYDDGWSDERVASIATATLGFPVSRNNVRGLRAQIIGPTRDRKPADDLDALRRRVAKLEAIVAKLEPLL